MSGYDAYDILEVKELNKIFEEELFQHDLKGYQKFYEDLSKYYKDEYKIGKYE